MDVYSMLTVGARSETSGPVENSAGERTSMRWCWGMLVVLGRGRRGLPMEGLQELRVCVGELGIVEG